MPDKTSLTIPFAAPAASAPETDLVLLEQEERGAYSGRVTKLGMARYLDWSLYAAAGTPAPRVVGCGGAPGDLDGALLVRPLRDGVRYRLFATVGSVGPGELGEIEETEIASFTLTNAASLRHPARRILSAEWLTGPWTTGGVRVPPPALAVSGRELRTSIPVYGSVRVRFPTRRYRHPLSIPWAEARALLATGDWSEWAVCLPDGGRPVALALSMNRGAADMAISGRDCGRKSGGRIKGEEPEWPPVVEPEDKRVHCDYCTGECEDDEE